MRYTANLDVIGDMPVFVSFLTEIATLGGIVQNVKTDTNGNFDVNVSFPTKQPLIDVLTRHYDGEESSFILEQIKTEYDEADFDLTKWQPMAAPEFIDMLWSLFTDGRGLVKVEAVENKLVVTYPMVFGEGEAAEEIVLPGIMAFVEGAKVRAFARKKGIPYFA